MHYKSHLQKQIKNNNKIIELSKLIKLNKFNK